MGVFFFAACFAKDIILLIPYSMTEKYRIPIKNKAYKVTCLEECFTVAFENGGLKTYYINDETEVQDYKHYPIHISTMVSDARLNLLVTAGYDLKVKFWSLKGWFSFRIFLPFPPPSPQRLYS